MTTTEEWTHAFTQDSGGGRPAALPPAHASPPAGDSENPPTPHGEGGTPLHSGPIPDERVYSFGSEVLARGSGGQLPPWSIHFFCPGCGTVWGRVDTGKPSPYYRAHSAAIALCLGCPQGTERDIIPGSCITALEREAARLGRHFKWADSLPVEVLRRETKVHMDWYEWARQHSDIYRRIA